MPSNFVIDCLFSCLSLLEFSVLIWHPAGDVHVICMHALGEGGNSPSEGGGSLLATGTVLEPTAGMFFL